MTTAWINILHQLEPDYSSYQKILDDGPKIIANISRVNLQWRVKIEEDWNNSNGEFYYTADYTNLDQRCMWAEEQLKNWRFVIRSSPREWKFFNKRQAEKFITLFTLVWT